MDYMVIKGGRDVQIHCVRRCDRLGVRYCGCQGAAAGTTERAGYRLQRLESGVDEAWEGQARQVLNREAILLVPQEGEARRCHHRSQVAALWHEGVRANAEQRARRLADGGRQRAIRRLCEKGCAEGVHTAESQEEETNHVGRVQVVSEDWR